MTQDQTVAALLTARQETLGLTNAEISRAIGIKSPNAISMIKKGHTKLPLKRVAAMASILEVSPARLLYLALMERDPDDFKAINDILQPEDWKKEVDLSA